MIADLHIHSKYSRATSKELDIEHLEKYARIKGVGLLGTGDFTHPKWIAELKAKLQDDGTGFLKTKTGFPFVLQTEVSSIYTQGGKGRRVHNVILAPDFDTADQITETLGKIGRLDYDGRPIFKLSCIGLVEKMKAISKDIEIIPAHIWTPWFGVLGSKSGFDTLKEAYGEYEKDIHSIETGLSSDPGMNWRLGQLDNKQILSFSDLHSYWPWRIGREATVFDIKPDYKSLLAAIRTGEGIKETIEVDPGYGKYHYDGHRNCGVSLEPGESKKNNNICPVCKGPLTIGVLNRIEELADREEGYKTENSKPYKTLIPLSEIISAVIGSGVLTKQVWSIYNQLTKGTDEFNVMLEMEESEIQKRVEDEKITEAIMKNRKGQIKVIPGYDGEYGIPVIDGKEPEKKTPKETHKPHPQKGLNDYF